MASALICYSRLSVMVTSDADVQPLQRTRAVLSPRLPVELIWEIVTMAAIQNHSTASNLSLVCNEMHRWMVPIIFHNIELTFRLEKRGLVDVIAEDETLTLANHVRNVKVSLATTEENSDGLEDPASFNSLIIRAYCRCAYVDRLVFDCWDPNETLLQPLGETIPNLGTFPNPWDVRISKHALSYEAGPLSHPYLQYVTHLYCDFTRLAYGNAGRFPACLRSVTHLGFAVEDFGEHQSLERNEIFKTLGIWLGRPSLKMLYMEYKNCSGYLDHPDAWERIIAMEDERLFVGRRLEEDFTCFTEDGLSVWNRVREIFENWREVASLKITIELLNS